MTCWSTHLDVVPFGAHFCVQFHEHGEEDCFAGTIQIYFSISHEPFSLSSHRPS